MTDASLDSNHDLLVTKINGNTHISEDAPDSPAIDSPATPVDDSTTHSVKIDVQSNDQDESAVRHEPVAMKVDTLENASIVPQAATPIDPDTIPFDPPKGTPRPLEGELLDDVKMAEAPAGALVADVKMDDADVPTPNHVTASPTVNGPSSPAPLVPSSTLESLAASSPYSNVSPNDDDVQPPPAKRARKHSDADQASLANTATPPPASVSPDPLPESATPHRDATPVPRGPATLSAAQYKFCLSIVRTLKKQKAAVPFLKPVDAVALNIPHYHSVIKHPMDLSTVERKLQSSNPQKPDSNQNNPRYYNSNEFIADVRLIFTNCSNFNGESHVITSMSRQLEEMFDKQMKNLPPPEVIKPPVVRKAPTPPPPQPPVQSKKPQGRRMSVNVPTVRRNEDPSGRPKREIHPPPPKDLPYADQPKKARRASVKDTSTSEQLKFCEKILKDLHKKVHYNIAQPFYDPVDWERLNLPSYPKIIKHPMDLSTMRKKLEAGQYPTADKFHQDFKLMIRNCFTFNPAGTPVNVAGVELQQVFDEKWRNLPPLYPPSEDEYEEEASEIETAHTVSMLESQIEDMQRQLASMKEQTQLPVKKTKKEKKYKVEKAQPIASSSKGTPKANGSSKVPPSIRKKMSKKPVTDDDVLSFEQKKELSDSIARLDGAKLERVIQIIHEGVPEIRDSTEEIELEIDTLPASVLTKLYNFVIRPNRAPPAKRPRTGKGTGTGGLKRKSMDEDVEAEKIRVLEERIRLFEQGGQASTSTASHAPVAAHGDDSEHSSDESSDDSSGSDSE
ncbi:Bromodomain-containing protein [Cytidiella melzeri]|nr:Bromodomain-containing protein [Cytidiella melzeri]